MAKSIVFCADGTWNGPGQDENKDSLPNGTNVLKTFCNLKGEVSIETAKLLNEQEKVCLDDKGMPVQIAKYIHGVGDSRNSLIHLLGGVFGAGVVQRIVRGYTFISRHYESGDRIYLIGFSRGAYTVRALSGLILSIGLLNKNTLDLSNKEAAYQYGVAAWVEYRRKMMGAKSSLFSYLTEFVARNIPAGGLNTEAAIETIAVWDTVGALGIPSYLFDAPNIDRLFRFVDNRLSKRVKQGLHAISIDECRAAFTPTLWEPADNVLEVWFAGAHADVGGGYSETGLSDIALEWISKRLEAAGLQFIQPTLYPLKQDPYLLIHEPWKDEIWKHGRNEPRTIPQGASLYNSVSMRFNRGGDYHPQALKDFIEAGRLNMALCKIIEWEFVEPGGIEGVRS